MYKRQIQRCAEVRFRGKPATDAQGKTNFTVALTLTPVSYTHLDVYKRQVVLDYQMPGMKGDVVAAKMKRVKSHVPIMLLSAYGPLPQNKLAAVDTFLSKSQPPKILLSTLQDLLNSQPKPFFSRWLDAWRSQNQRIRH